MATTEKIVEERKTLTKLSKRLKSSEQVTQDPRADKPFTRLMKTRKFDAEKETSTRSSQNDHDNDLIETTTAHWRLRPESEKDEASITKTQPTRPSILSRRAKELPRENVAATTKRSRVWFSAHLDKNFQEPTRPKNPEESSTRRSASPSTTTRRTRAWNAAYIDRNWEEPTRKSVTSVESSTTRTIMTLEAKSTVTASTTTDRTLPTNDSSSNRYVRKKSDGFKPFEATPKLTTTEKPLQTVKRREFRPRTATYRRHSEAPKVMIVNAVPAEKSSSSGSIAITPKAPLKFHSTLRESTSSSAQRSARQEPTVNVQISNDAQTKNTSSEASGIVGISNGDSGQSSSNIFNPTRSTFLLNSNATFLEQLRSTVAPLLGALGNRTPIFAGAYRDVQNSVSRTYRSLESLSCRMMSNYPHNSTYPFIYFHRKQTLEKRITPSGSPPRFSARYKGAELFVRKPNVLEPAGPFLTSSTTPFPPTEVRYLSYFFFHHL